jgi:hypothetical protein
MRPVRYQNELNVNLTDEIKAALITAVEFTGTTAGQYARQAILEKLLRERFISHPMARHSEAAE